ncbi:6707_t:CDS:2, partial [Scutellospora calospora]
MTDINRLNPLAPVTAAVSKFATSNVVQGTQNLLFHRIHNTKESKEVFADYVTIIRSKPFSKLSPVEKELYKKKLEETCRKLLTRLSRVGLKYEVRRGSDDLIFVFVLCPLDRLKQESDRSRVHDWLTGVRIRDIDENRDAPLTDAERLRLVHDIITNPLYEGGANIYPGLGDFEIVEGFLPLHDRIYNEDWIKTWSTKWMIDKDDLLRLRNHFGEKIAYYFAFLQFYCKWLVIPSIVGIVSHFSGAKYSIPFSIFTVIWSLTFVEFWRRKEYELAVWWGVRNFSRVERRRPEFREERFITDPVTGEQVPYFSPWKRWLRRTIAAPVIMSEYYSGPFRDQLKVGPERLVTELKYFVLTAQILSMFTELILPYLIRFGAFSMKRIQNNGATKDGGRNEDESVFLKRVRKEVKLPVYEIYEDYAEMITQYGYVSLFSTVWPLTPLFALLNNWFELRSDAIKLCQHTRRPIPRRADSIGPWLDNLVILTWFSSITNPSLIYLYHYHSDTNAFTSPLSVIIIIALIWFTEHIFDVVHYLVKQ